MFCAPPPGLCKQIYTDGGDGGTGAAGGHPVFMPQTAHDFKILGLGVPSSLWPCQEAAGNLAGSLGGFTLTAGGAPTYQNTKTAWTKKALVFTQVASQRFQAASGTGPNPSTQSVSWFCYFYLTGAPAANGRLLMAAANSATTGVMALFQTTGVIRLDCKGVTATGAYNYNDGLVHPCLMVYDRTNTLVRIYTDKEQVDGTYDAGTADNQKGIGGIGASTPAPAGVLWLSCSSGAVAEGRNKSTLSRLGWTLAY